MRLREEQTWTMKVYVLQGDPDYHWLRPCEVADWNWRGGVPIAFAWKEPSLQLADEDGSEFVGVDCFAMNTGADGPILGDYARRALQQLIGAAGEFWPVRVLGHRYWWFNCLAQVDALDPDATEADWEAVSGEWGEFRWITLPQRLAFRREALERAPAIFRVPQFPQGVLFVRDAFARGISRQKLTGFKLDLVWSEEEGGVRDPAGFGLEGVFDERRPGEVARKRARALAMLNERRIQASGDD